MTSVSFNVCVCMCVCVCVCVCAACGMEVSISKIQMEHTTPEMAIWSFLRAFFDTPICLRSYSVMVRKVMKSTCRA